MYLPPLTLEHLPYVEEALHQFNGWYPIVLGDINMDLDNALSLQIQCVVELLIEFGLIDLVRNFRHHHQFRDLKTWTQVRQGTVLH